MEDNIIFKYIFMFIYSYKNIDLNLVNYSKI